METAELLKKVRKIEIKTRGLSTQMFSGEYHSAFKGRGMAFSEVREYMPGDDIRAIDWNVTARFNHPFVKIFEEERELNVMLLVDVSASENFGTNNQFKSELITELCAVLSFSAIQNNDKIGVVFFSDEIELFIPPKKGKSHILRIIRESLAILPKSKGTRIANALNYLNSVVKKRSIVFILSDFKDSLFENELKIANRKHDVVALQISDRSEQELPDLGLIKVYDSESGMEKWVDTSNEEIRYEYRKAFTLQNNRIKRLLRKTGVDFVQLETGKPYINLLLNLFKMRGR